MNTLIDNSEKQDMMLNLQLVYVYIESSYSGIGGIELQLGNGVEFHFVRSEPNLFSMQYYFTKQEVNYITSADTFFDSNKHLKRLDVLVGENGTGKTTILNTIAGIGPIGSWIELFYSYDSQEYYFYSDKNAYKSIEEKAILEADAYLDNRKLKKIDLGYRKVYLHSNEYQPEFLWTTEEDQEYKNIMKCDYTSVGRFLFQQSLKRQHFNLPCSFTFEIGLLVDEENTPNVIRRKQQIIECLNDHDEHQAIEILEGLIKRSLEVLHRITIGNPLVSEKELEKKIKNLEKDYQAMIQCLNEIADNNTLSIITHMKHSTSHSAQVANAEKKVNKVNVELELEFGEWKIENLLMNFLMIMDNLKINTRIHQFQLIFFRCGFQTMSSGELAYLKLYAEIYCVLKQHAQHPGIILLLFDEPEVYMHPEWSRQMISNIVKVITDLYDEHQEWRADCQLLITTHTPYLLSDLLPCFITRIQKGEDNLYIYKGEHSFAANLYDILNSNFFVSNPIGEFALSKLNYMLVQGEYADAEKYKELIENIGDEYLRKQLERLLGDQSW